MKKILSVLMVCMMFFTQIVPIHAEDDMINFKTDVTYGQTKAREMVNLINDWRNSGSWYYDKNNNKVETGPLPSFDYDYDLEAIAMKRAVQVAAEFKHEQPDGESIWKLENNGVFTYGENIAAGPSTAQGAFQLFQENDKPYGEQGHRLQMLSHFQSIGIGHVIVGGVNYWVQEFGLNVPISQPTAANDSTVRENIAVRRSDILKLEVRVYNNEYQTANNGDTISVPRCEGYFHLKDGFRSIPVDEGITYSWAPTQYGTISGNTLTLDPKIAGKTIFLRINADCQGVIGSTEELTDYILYVNCRHNQVHYKYLNKSSHEKICNICGKKLGKEKHVFVNNKCSDCGFKKPKKKFKGLKAVINQKVRVSGRKVITRSKTVKVRLIGVKGKNKWFSSNKRIAVVKKGKVTFRRKGTVTIGCKVKKKVYKLQLVYK